MALTTIANGQLSDASQVDQFFNLLTGVMNDQPVTLKGDATRAPAMLSLDSTVPSIQVLMQYLDAGAVKWQLGKDTDNTFLLYDLVNAGQILRAYPTGPVQINSIKAAALQSVIRVARAGTEKYGIGLTGADVLAILNAAESAAILTLDNSGNLGLPSGNLALSAGNSQFIQLTDASATPNKYMRTNSGIFQIIASDGATAILDLNNAGLLSVPAGQGLDTIAAGQINLMPTTATLSTLNRGPKKSLVVNTTLTALGAGAQTLTSTALIGGNIEHTVTAAVDDTIDTGTNLDNLFATTAVGDSFSCILTIIGAFTVTLTAGTGITIKGTTALVGVAAGKDFLLTFRRTGAATWTCYVNASA